MQTAALNYKLIKKIKDERFDEDLIDRYHLLINIGTRDLQLGVIDPAEGRMLLLEDFVFPALSSHEDLLVTLEHLFDAHAFLKAAFWKSIKVSFKNSKFVQVPQALYVPEAKEEYLKFNAVIEPSEEVLAIDNPRTKAITIFAVQKNLIDLLSRLYPKNPPQLIHQSATLIEAVAEFSKTNNGNPLYIYVDRFKLHILSCVKGKLIYYNQFVIKQFSDYIRYIMLVMKSMNLEQDSSQVILWGYIGKNSPHYQEFYKYINNVVFGQRPVNLSFSYMFDEVQDHHFLDLYSMHLLGKP